MVNKTKIIGLLLLLYSFLGYGQVCEQAKKLFENDLYSSKELREYASKAEDSDKVFDAWQILHNENLTTKTNATILKEVENNYQAITNAGGYLRQKKLQGAENELTALLLKSGEEFTILTNARKLPGTSIGNGKNITSIWLRSTERNAGLFPKSVADKLKGKTFNSFDDFRNQFWKAVADEPSLASQFDANSIKRMQGGLAPFTDVSQQIGGMKNYVLHHKTPINQRGAVYDMDNLYIVTPKYHKEILDPAYHYGYRY